MASEQTSWTGSLSVVQNIHHKQCVPRAVSADYLIRAVHFRRRDSQLPADEVSVECEGVQT